MVFLFVFKVAGYPGEIPREMHEKEVVAVVALMNTGIESVTLTGKVLDPS